MPRKRHTAEEIIHKLREAEIALAKGLIKAKGPMPKVLKLLPLLKPAYAAYPDWAQSHGLSIA